MRALLPLLAMPLVACQAIVGTYEVESGDSGAPDTATAADAKTDTEVTDSADSGVIVKSCKRLLAEGKSHGQQQIVAPGPGYPSGVSTFCDMMGGGWTLVATRSATTNGNVWSGGSAVPKKTELGPNDDTDGVLDIDWKLLGFSDVSYELGLPAGTGMRMPRTRATFPMLSDAHQNLAKSVLFEHPMGAAKRPDCVFAGAGTTYRECIAPMGTFDGGSPIDSLGWLFAPNGVDCFWAYRGKAGTQDCATGAVGGGRIFVK